MGRERELGNTHVSGSWHRGLGSSQRRRGTVTGVAPALGLRARASGSLLCPVLTFSDRNTHPHTHPPGLRWHPKSRKQPPFHSAGPGSPLTCATREPGQPARLRVAEAAARIPARSPAGPHTAADRFPTPTQPVLAEGTRGSHTCRDLSRARDSCPGPWLPAWEAQVSAEGADRRASERQQVRPARSPARTRPRQPRMPTRSAAGCSEHHTGASLSRGHC